MKINELTISEEAELNLIGMEIDGKLITKDTMDDRWEGNFSCSSMGLTSLKGAPLSVTGHFWCHSNRLVSLEGAPAYVQDDFYCAGNLLISLKGAPDHIGGSFNCEYNRLATIEGAPRTIDNGFYCEHNQITSLKDVHKITKEIRWKFGAKNNPIESHVLGLLLVEGLHVVNLDNAQVQGILNTYVREGRSALLACQNELLDNGFEEYAKL